MIEPHIWTVEELKDQSLKSIEVFRTRRIEEPLEDYLEAFDEYQGIVEDLLEATVDLSKLKEQLIPVLTDPNLLEALRYIVGPPISEDDLKTVAETSLTPSRLRSNPSKAKDIAQIVLNGLDRRRFAWVAEGREPSEAERSAAVLASAALLATSSVQTGRRTSEKRRQEEGVMQALVAAGLIRVAPRPMYTLADAPKAGEFCAESMMGTRKADIIVGLCDGRVMPIECKVSNSATNSVKRLNNDAAAKAVVWRHDFGYYQVVPSAVLSGVYKPHNLDEAQTRGLRLFWAHDVAHLVGFIVATKG